MEVSRLWVLITGSTYPLTTTLALVPQDQIVRFGGLTDPTLPWPEKFHAEADNIEKRPAWKT